MKILISGGAITNNIINPLQKKLASSGIDFLAVEYIEDIKRLLANGEYFDRAIITEDSWSHNGNDTDEMSWRSKINNFSNSVNGVLRENTSYVFLSKTNDMAGIAGEEIMSIRTSSILIVKELPFTVNFFVMLATWEFNQIPDKYLYHPISEEPEIEVEEADNNENEYQQDLNFNGDYDNNANRLPIDEGSEQDPFAGIPELGGGGFGQPNDWENPDQGWENPDQGWENPDQGWDNPEQQDWQGQGQEYNPNSSDSDYDNPGDNEWQNGGYNPNNNLGGLDNPGGDLGGVDENSPSFSEFNQNQENQYGGQEYPQYNPAGGFNEYNGQNDQYTPDQGQGEDWRDAGSNPDLGQQPQSGDIPDWSGSDTGFNPFSGQNNEQYQYNPADYQQQNDNQQGYTEQGEVQQGYPEQTDYQQPYNDEYNPSDYEAPVEIDQSDYSPQENQAYSPEEYANHESNDTPEEYTNEERNNTQRSEPAPQLNNNQMKAMLNTFAAKGTSILVTGFGGTGSSVIAYNLANIISGIGYNVLLVDMDTIEKAQSYLSKDAYDAMTIDNAAVMSAVNGNSGINAYESIVKPGFSILSMGMGADAREAKEAFKLDRITRFINQARYSYNFIIYDIQFDDMVGPLSQVLYQTDNLVLTVDTSNWGISKALIKMCNVGSDDVEDAIFGRGQLLFNRYRGLNKLFGERVKNVKGITKLMDKKLYALTGEETGYEFSRMRVCGMIKEDPHFEECWYNSRQYTDTQKGFNIFAKILQDILIHSK